MNEIGEFTPVHPLNTPVLFLIFNRPDTTQLVFNEIRKAKPKQLFIAADGPRKNHPEDAILCKQTRAIIDQVDWDCKVTILFRDENLGCKVAISSAIDWFFSHVEEGIILEDDCVPDQSFFPFCEELLEKYRNDERIMVISGDNFQFGRKRTQDSYYFSRYSSIWGWASWRRAWKYYDVTMELWPRIRDENWLMDILRNRNAVNYWKDCFNKTYSGKIDTWDYQWMFACWTQNGLTILPNVNLVSNIGFDRNATHTAGSSNLANISTHSLEFPLVHPLFFIRDDIADSYSQKVIFTNNPIIKLRNKFQSALKYP